jgi:hypothetical protein
MEEQLPGRHPVAAVGWFPCEILFVKKPDKSFCHLEGGFELCFKKLFPVHKCEGDLWRVKMLYEFTTISG